MKHLKVQKKDKKRRKKNCNYFHTKNCLKKIANIGFTLHSKGIQHKFTILITCGNLF